MSRKSPPFFTFSISHQTYTTNFTLVYHKINTNTNVFENIEGYVYQKLLDKRKSNQSFSKRSSLPRRYHTRWLSTIHETHTTKTTRDHEDDGIRRYHTRWWSTIHKNDSRSWRWWYHGKRVYSKISQKQLEIMKMMVSEDITHDEDQLSTKTSQDPEDGGIMETEEDFEEKRVYSKTTCVIFYIWSWVWYDICKF